MIRPVLRASSIYGLQIAAFITCDNCGCEILPKEIAYQSEESELCEECYTSTPMDKLSWAFGVDVDEATETDGAEIALEFLNSYTKHKSPEELRAIAEAGRARLRKLGYDVI